jgi:hypothetical protein
LINRVSPSRLEIPALFAGRKLPAQLLARLTEALKSAMDYSSWEQIQTTTPDSAPSFPAIVTADLRSLQRRKVLDLLAASRMALPAPAVAASDLAATAAPASARAEMAEAAVEMELAAQ